MSKVTSKLQITLPKAIADRYAIRPGDDLEFVPAGDGLRVVLPGRSGPTVEERLASFDAATKRQRRRASSEPVATEPGRGWTREELHDRGRSD